MLDAIYLDNLSERRPIMQNNKWIKLVVYLIIASMLLSTLVMGIGLIL